MNLGAKSGKGEKGEGGRCFNFVPRVDSRCHGEVPSRVQSTCRRITKDNDPQPLTTSDVVPMYLGTLAVM